MAANKLIERMRKGEKALGMHVTFPDDEIIEVCGRLGLDFIFFEGQHAPMNAESIARMCRLADGFGITPSMRAPDHHPGTILTCLDCGIKAIMVPMLETKSQAEALVRACYFAPQGQRSYASLRTIEYNFDSDCKTIMGRVNANMMLIPQIETIAGIENLDEILTVDGIECFAHGPNDLAQSMGFVGEPNHPECLAATRKAEDKINAAGKTIWTDITESIMVAPTIHAAGRDLLQKHGRTQPARA